MTFLVAILAFRTDENWFQTPKKESVLFILLYDNNIH